MRAVPREGGAVSNEAASLTRTITGEELTSELSGDNTLSCRNMNGLFLKGNLRGPLIHLPQYLTNKAGRVCVPFFSLGTGIVKGCY